MQGRMDHFYFVCLNKEWSLYLESQQKMGTSVHQNHLTQVTIQASFILKWEGVWPVVANFLVLARH